MASLFCTVLDLGKPEASVFSSKHGRFRLYIKYYRFNAISVEPDEMLCLILAYTNFRCPFYVTFCIKEFNSQEKGASLLALSMKI